MSASQSPGTPGGPGAGSSMRRWLWPAIAAITALVLVIVAVVVLGDGNSGDEPGAGGTTSSTGTTAPTTASPSTPATGATSSPTSTAPVAGQIAVPVYYVVDVEGVGPRLYREFHNVAATGDTVKAALTEMFAGAPRDPDYQSLWPSTTRVLSVERLGGGVVQVDVSGFVQLGASFEGAAVQQLVHTATAAEPANTQVKLLVNGATPPSGHMDWSDPVKRSAPLETLSNVWVLAPVQGSTVSSPVTVKVYGTGFEGNVPLKVFKQGTEVASTQVTTMMGGFMEAQTAIKLPAGSYELRAYNDSGQDGSLTLWDTKAFTVR